MWYRKFCSAVRSTIFALSSGSGRCGVAVVRISGPAVPQIICNMTSGGRMPSPRTASLRKIIHPRDKETIDNGILLWFPGPRSFTGEDCCELQVHGGVAVLRHLLQALSTVPGCRHAQPGEFSRRAFLNGKLDLTQAEGLADLIEAETEIQRKQALRQLEGNLFEMYEQYKNTLTKLIAHIEAWIDFSEEDQVEEDVLSRVHEDVHVLRSTIESHLNDARRGERVRTGTQLAILGRPNVGKSTLLNYMCQREAAIVSSIPGTTRDIVTSCLDIEGYPVIISDTAGLRLSDDPIESEGVRRSRKMASGADLLLLVSSFEDIQNEISARTKTNPEEFMGYVTSHITMLLSEHELDVEAREIPSLIVINKCDLAIDLELAQSLRRQPNVCATSFMNEEGLTDCMQKLKSALQQMCTTGHTPAVTRERHRACLEVCVQHLNSYLQQDDPVIAAHILRRALHQLGLITGAVTNEQILDVLFSDFCIGK